MEHSARLQYLVGQKFGRLEVVEVYKKEPPRSSAQALCKCECGSEPRPYDVHSLHRGRAKSCGCVTKERMTGNKFRSTHGEAGWRNGRRTAEYETWLSMQWRCHPNNTNSANDYFKRGIAVCERWKKYENFLEDMGRKPSPKHELDRRDNDLGYYKDNCHWATELEQVLNRSNATFVYLDGEIMTMIEAAERLGIGYHALYSRTEPIEWDSDADRIAALRDMKHPPTLHI